MTHSADIEGDARNLYSLLDIAVAESCEICRFGLTEAQAGAMDRIGSLLWTSRDISERLKDDVPAAPKGEASNVAAPTFLEAAAAFAALLKREYSEVSAVDEDSSRLSDLGDLEKLLASCVSAAPSYSLGDLAAKAAVMKMHLPAGRPEGTLWEHATEADRLAWSVADEVIKFASAKTSGGGR